MPVGCVVRRVGVALTHRLIATPLTSNRLPNSNGPEPTTVRAGKPRAQVPREVSTILTVRKRIERSSHRLQLAR